LSPEEIQFSAPAGEVKKTPLKKWLIPFVVLFLVIAVDQYLKYWVKHHMVLHTEKKILGNWFMFHYTENEGMAFGMKFFGEKGKYALSILRILVSLFGFWYLITHIRKNANTAFLICVALILGGALGNIIDCIFYGVWYQSMNEYSGGYLLGWVVDMLYFPIIEAHYPSWSPIKPGQEFIFFSPVFNLADAAISTGVIAIIIFQKRFFKKRHDLQASSMETQLVAGDTIQNHGEKEETL
jgi:signal peptidase II